MLDAKLIETVTKKLVEAYNPLSIYLFGSYAWGTPNEDSDLDLLIVIDSYESNHQMLVKGHRALARLRVAKDILLYSKEEFMELSEKQTNLCYKIKHDGIKIYTRDLSS